MSKFLFQPVRPFRISQLFGENKACIPIEGGGSLISCDGHNPPPGYKSVYGKEGHTGIDIPADSGQPVYCSYDGEVSSIDTNPRTGLDVRIVSSFEGKSYQHVYEHLLGHNVKKGQTVKTGECIGWADNTGYSSGNHLHFTLKLWSGSKGWQPIDPLPYMNQYFAPNVSLVHSTLEKIAVAMEMLIDLLRRRK